MQSIEALAGREMAERYEIDLDLVRKHAADMQSLVHAELPQQATILCIATEPSPFTNKKEFLELPEVIRQYYSEVIYGGIVGPRNGDQFRYLLGFAVGDPRFVIWDITKQSKSPVNLNTVDGIIITGSSAMMTEIETDEVAQSSKWILNALEVVKYAKTLPIPIMGFCFGHQLMAVAGGGVVDWMRDTRGQHIRELGPVQIELTPEGQESPLLQGLSTPISIYAAHSQAVMKVPQDAVVLARNAVSEVQALSYPGTPHWSVQNHPEFSVQSVHVRALLRKEHIQEELAQLSQEVKEQLGVETYDHLIQRIATTDVSHIRPAVFQGLIQSIIERAQSQY